MDVLSALFGPKPIMTIQCQCFHLVIIQGLASLTQCSSESHPGCSATGECPNTQILGWFYVKKHLHSTAEKTVVLKTKCLEWNGHLGKLLSLSCLSPSPANGDNNSTYLKAVVYLQLMLYLILYLTILTLLCLGIV